MWLVNAITPDHGTIAGFVENNREAFHETLRNLTLILKGWGLIDGKLIAIDGTKILAQNSRHNCITISGLEKKLAYADEQINAYLIAIEKDAQSEPEFKKKLEAYQAIHEETLGRNETYKQRRCIVEHPFGTVKRSLGYRYFLRQRTENVDAEASSMFIAYNFKRLLTMFSPQELIESFD